jgi:hypothetical protein
MDPNASPEPPDEDLSADGAVEEDDDDEEEEYQSPHDLISDEELIVGGSEIDAPTITRGFKRVKFDEIAKMKGDPRYNPRGLLEPAARGSKELQRLFFFGPAKDDQMPALKSHYRWGAELTIPSHEANAGGFGGFKTSYYHSDAAMKTESEVVGKASNVTKSPVPYLHSPLETIHHLLRPSCARCSWVHTNASLFSSSSYIKVSI